MSNETIREIKQNLCMNCGDRCCCRGMQNCKDVNDYMAKEKERK